MTTPTQRMATIAKQIAAGRYGYDQGATARWSGLDKAGRKLRTTGEFDCSSSTAAIVYLGGDPIDLSTNTWTGNLAGKLRKAGWDVMKFPGLAKVRKGDILLTPGRHVVFQISAKTCVSAEHDERAKSAGGKTGDQTGREIRLRPTYNRPGGWTYLCRRVAINTWALRALAAFRDGNTAEVNRILAIIDRRSPRNHGPAWRTFMATLTRHMAGISLAYTPTALAIPQTGHAFVVLGSKLKTNGSLDAKGVRRLRVALPALLANPASKVIVSGGKPYNGTTEAAAMRTWLAGQGIDPARILTEETSGSTVGNAKYSVPLAVKTGLTTLTLVSDASHLRRAGLLFLAAQLVIETATNKPCGITYTTPLAYPDNTKAEGPASTTTRTEIANEIAALIR
jgi:hypothetical protein